MVFPGAMVADATASCRSKMISRFDGVMHATQLISRSTLQGTMQRMVERV